MRIHKNSGIGHLLRGVCHATRHLPLSLDLSRDYGWKVGVAARGAYGAHAVTAVPPRGRSRWQWFKLGLKIGPRIVLKKRRRPVPKRGYRRGWRPGE